MDIAKLIDCARKPSLYQEGTAVMWTDPHISRELLKYHIDPDNDVASRNDRKITSTVDWILARAGGEALNILDLGCGPGLYAEKLAARGHRVTGVDFSANSIAYAREVAEKSGSRVDYVCGNYLDLAYAGDFDLAILIYLDFCVLKPEERKIVLENIHAALKPGGLFVFDVVNAKNIEAKIMQPSWEVAPRGFWRDEPYMALNKGYHFPEQHALVNQHVVVTGDEKVDTYLFWSTYYEYSDLSPLLAQAGFRDVQSYENVLPPGDAWNGENATFYAVRK